MQEDNILGVEQIEIGLPGDGVAGVSLTVFKDVVLNSLNLSTAKVKTKDIPSEGKDIYLTVTEGSDPTKTGFKLLGVPGESAVMLIGGAWDAPTKKFSGPKEAVGKYLTVVITSKPVKGQKAKITFPYMHCVSNWDGGISKGDLLPISIEGIANIPTTALGVENDPYEIQWIDA